MPKYKLELEINVDESDLPQVNRWFSDFVGKVNGLNDGQDRLNRPVQIEVESCPGSAAKVLTQCHVFEAKPKGK